MSLCRLDIRKSLVNEIFDRLSQGISVEQINTDFKEEVVEPVTLVINPSESLIDKYWEANQPNTSVKEGVDFVFEQSPELAKIGSQEQYSQYLDSIFPDSKVKDIVYHGTNEEFDKFDKSKLGTKTGNKTNQLGFYFSDKNVASIFNSILPKDYYNASDKKLEDLYKAYSERYGQERAKEILDELVTRSFDKTKMFDRIYLPDSKFISSILNIKNPLIDNTEDFAGNTRGDGFNALNIYKEKIKNNDGIILKALEDGGLGGEEFESDNYVVFEPEQIHILGSKQDIEGFTNFVNKSNNEEGTALSIAGEVESSKASPETLTKVKEFLKRLGIEIKDLDSRYGGINGIAKLLENAIEMAQGKEDVALTEETMHFVVELIKTSDNTLYKQLMNKVGSYQLYNSLLNSEYAKTYLKDGKIDIVKIKEEAIAKILAEYYIKAEEGSTEKPELLQQAASWLELIKAFIQKLLGKAQFNPFEKAIQDFQENKIVGNTAKSFVDRINLDAIQGMYKEGFKQAVEEGKYTEVLNSIKDQLTDPNSYDATVKNILEGDTQLAQDIINSDFLSIQNKAVDDYYNAATQMHKESVLVPKIGDIARHYLYKGIKAAKSVTEKLKYLDKKFANPTEEQQERTDQLAEWGSKGHAFIEDFIKENLIDSEGYAKEATNNPVTSDLNKGIQKSLAAFATELIASYPAGTRFLIENRFFNMKDKGMTGTTEDFKAIIPGIDGTISKIDTLDWKFFNMDTKNYSDIPWYKNDKWNAQIGEFIKIDRQLGITSEQTGKSRIIPFISNYHRKIEGDNKSPLVLNSIEIGKLDSTKETKVYLLPVAVEEESTGNKILNNKIGQLKEEYRKLHSRQVGEDKRIEKNDKLETLASAIKQLHMQINFDPLKEEGKRFLNTAKNALDKYSDSFAGLSEVELNNIAKELRVIEESANIYLDLSDVFLTAYPKDTLVAGSEQIKTFYYLEALSNSSQRLLQEITEKKFKIATALALKENFFKTTNEQEIEEKLKLPELEITDWASTMFGVASKLSSRVIQLMQKMWINKKRAQAIQEKKLGNQLNALLPEFFKAASGYKNALDAIKEKDSHNLIFKTSKKFFEDIKKAKADEDKEFLLKNLNLDSYNKTLEELIKGKEDATYVEDEEENDIIKQQEIKKLKDNLDISNKNFKGFKSPIFNYYYGIHSKKEENLSDAYKEMQKTPAILAVWEFFIGLNELGRSVGYNKNVNFLPYVEASIIEQLNQSDKDIFSTAKDLLKQGYVLNINEEVSHAKTNKQTGKIENVIPKLFTRKSQSLEDYNYSTDLVKITGPWIKALLSYKTASEAEDTFQILRDLEASKEHLQVVNGKVVFKNDAPQEFSGNAKNTAIFETIMEDNIYFTQENSNTLIDLAVDKVSKNSEEDATKQKLQVKKVIQRANTWTAALATGFKLMVSIPNTVGVGFQAVINSGNFYTAPEYLGNLKKVPMSLSNIDKGLIDLIHPLNEDASLENTRKFAKKQSGLAYLKTWSFNDVIHLMNRTGELVHELANAKTFNDNSMVLDGKIINIRQYLTEQDSKKYDISFGEVKRKELEKTFESRIKELQAKSLSKIAVFNAEGFLEIPGVSDEEIAKYATKVSEYARNSSGKTSRDNKAEWERSAIARSFMMFKGWIPKQVDLRAHDIEYNQQLDSWEYGRARLFAKTITHLGIKRCLEMRDIITGNENGLRIMKEILDDKKAKYYLKTGQKLEITDEEFFDMMRKELHSQSKELVMLASVLSLFFASKLAAPDKDDDDYAKNRYKWWRKLFNKISNELDFYYNPMSADSITRGSIIPSLSILTKTMKAFRQLGSEVYGETTNDQKLIDDSHPGKYFLNLMPGPAQFQNELLPYFFPEAAKEWGIKFTEQSRAGN